MSPTTTKQRRRRLQIPRRPGRAEPSPGGSSRGSPGSGGDAPGPPPPPKLSAHPGRRSHLPSPQMAPQRRRPGKVSLPQNHRAPSPSVWGRGISGETAVPCREPPPPGSSKRRDHRLGGPLRALLGRAAEFRAHGRRLRFLIPFLAPPAHLPPAHAQRTNRPPKK